MTRPLVAWLLFAIIAAVPSTAVLAVAVRAAAAETARVHEEERAARANAARAVERDVEAAILRSKETLRRLSDSKRAADELAPARPRFADVIVVDAAGQLEVPPPPEVDTAPSATCLEARARLATASRPDARAAILAQCTDLRSESGRYLWPLLAIEEPSTLPGLAAWLARHHGRLGPSERLLLQTRIAALAVSGERAEALAALERAPSLYSTLATLVTEPTAADVTDGSIRLHRGRYLGIVAVLSDGTRAGYAVHEESLARGVMLAPDQVLVAGRASDGSNVALAPRLAIHVAARDASSPRSSRSGTSILLATSACVVLSVALAAVLFARARRAQRLAELRTDFVAAVSHELRTPAASVRMLAELLERGDVPAEERAEIESTLAGETRRLSATLDRMLRFGALARGKLVAEPREIAIQPLLTDAAARFASAHEGKRVVVEAADDLEGTVDPGLVSLALDNLLSNAAKYAPEGGPYRLHARADGGAVVIGLTDTGPGIDRSAQARVFLPFERADDRLSRATEGTGVGLALVRAIARAHGGDATVESAPGRGATFALRLPHEET